ncbi:MAG TPA: hypothetical protein VIC57_12815 [Candidatus Dormibacteraeota bacterium]|jgi:hypothetical protein
MAGIRSGVDRRRPRVRARPAGLGALAIIGLAAIAGLAGLVLFLSLVAPPPPSEPAAPGRLVAGDLVFEMQTAGWITHDDVGGPVPASVENGFQMPASMMPGMPDPGVQRLYLEAVLSNAGCCQAAFAPREFSVRSAAGQTFALDQPATFDAGSLGPGQSRSLDLLFDVPDTVSTLDLVWTHGGQVQFARVGASPPPIHDHAGG